VLVFEQHSTHTATKVDVVPGGVSINFTAIYCVYWYLYDGKEVPIGLDLLKLVHDKILTLIAPHGRLVQMSTGVYQVNNISCVVTSVRYTILLLQDVRQIIRINVKKICSRLWMLFVG
jgi:hypothetical protein